MNSEREKERERDRQGGRSAGRKADRPTLNKLNSSPARARARWTVSTLHVALSGPEKACAPQLEFPMNSISQAIFKEFFFILKVI